MLGPQSRSACGAWPPRTLHTRVPLGEWRRREEATLWMSGAWCALLLLGPARGVGTCLPTRLGPRLLQSPVGGTACDVSLMTSVQPRRLPQRQGPCRARGSQAHWEGVGHVPRAGSLTPVDRGGTASRPPGTVCLGWVFSQWWALYYGPFVHDDLIQSSQS